MGVERKVPPNVGDSLIDAEWVGGYSQAEHSLRTVAISLVYLLPVVGARLSGCVFGE